MKIALSVQRQQSRQRTSWDLITRSGPNGRRDATNGRARPWPLSLVVVAAFGDLLGRCDSDPVRRCRQFERICQWFLINDPV